MTFMMAFMLNIVTSVSLCIAYFFPNPNDKGLGYLYIGMILSWVVLGCCGYIVHKFVHGLKQEDVDDFFYAILPKIDSFVS